jgi:hypothetical protein
MKCSICGGKFSSLELTYWGGKFPGHNAEPINDGRCCGHCNETVVIPARYRLLQQHDMTALDDEALSERLCDGVECRAFLGRKDGARVRRGR